jgi:hypothetical protein
VHRRRALADWCGNRFILHKRQTLVPFLSVGLERTAVVLELPRDEPEFVDDGRHVTMQHSQLTSPCDRIDQFTGCRRACRKGVEPRL